MPRSLRADLAPHEVRTVGELGWAGHARLSASAPGCANGFDVLLTVAQAFVQRRNLPLVVIVLTAVSNTATVLRPMMSDVLEQLAALEQPQPQPPTSPGEHSIATRCTYSAAHHTPWFSAS